MTTRHAGWAPKAGRSMEEALLMYSQDIVLQSAVLAGPWAARHFEILGLLLIALVMPLKLWGKPHPLLESAFCSSSSGFSSWLAKQISAYLEGYFD